MGKRFKIAVVTAARSEYGLLQWIITDLENDPDIELSLIVCGSHLSPAQGLTVQQIEADGHKIAKKVEFLLSTQTDEGLAKSTGLCAVSVADALADIRPQIIIVLGDRYELLPICTTALLMNIPIAHLSGGDITEGAIDNQVRNAVTMLSTLHFPGTAESAANIERMTGSSQRIYNVGEPGLETFRRKKLMSRSEIASDLGLDSDKQWILCTLHPETMQSVAYSLDMAETMMTALLQVKDCEIVITAANADLGGDEMNSFFLDTANTQSNVHFIPSLGQLRYLSMMNEAEALVGNTSSGIVEAPVLGKTVFNIGNRQTGRHMCRNVICVPANDYDALKEAMDGHIGQKCEPDNYYGDGRTSAKVIAVIKDYLSCKE